MVEMMILEDNNSKMITKEENRKNLAGSLINVSKL